MDMSDQDGTCFDPDQSSGWSEKEFARFVASQPWIFARTMPENPHEYALRRQGTNANFEAAVRFIREHGLIEDYRGRSYKILYFGNHKYWTMGAPLAETILINRKPHSQD